MTLQSGVWAIDAGNMTGQIARLFFRSATRNSEGIVEIGDLLVKALDVPGAAVQVGDGAAIMRGKEALWQGSYWGYNLGTEQVDINPTSGSPRTDLVWLRMEDPTFPSSPWSHDPATDTCMSFVVTEGVSAGTTSIPEGFTGIPLALITIPASTAAITSGMITDLRFMADPRTKTELYSLNGVWDTPDGVGNVTDWEEFPNGASWDIDVPDWASQAVVSFTFGGLQYLTSGGNGTGSNTDAQGFLRATLGSQSTDSIRYWVRTESGQYSRVTYSGGDTLDLAVAVRGTTQTLKLEGSGVANYKGSLEADGGAGVVAQVLFREVPVTDEPDRSPK